MEAVSSEREKNGLSPWLTGVSLALISLLAGYLYYLHGNAEETAVRGHSAALWMVARWGSVSGDLSHAWLIPLVSFYALWTMRGVLRALPKRPDLRGLAAFTVALGLYWLGVRGQQTRLTLLSLLLLLWSVPFVFWGWGVARQTLFPALYLLFCIPYSFLDSLTFPLRIVATTLATFTLNGIGIAAVRSGTAIHSLAGGGFHLDVADPCSGLHSLLPLVALSAAYAWFFVRGKWTRWLLVVAALPLAVAGNVVRIVSIALVARFFGQERATGFYHDYSSYVFFAVALSLTFVLAGWLNRLAGNSQVSDAAPRPLTSDLRPPTSDLRPPPSGYLSRLLPPLLLAVLAIWTSCAPPVVLETSCGLRDRLPARIGNFEGDDLLYCQNEQCLRSFTVASLNGGAVCPVCGGALAERSVGERTILPRDTTILKKVYTASDGRSYLVTVVFSGEDQRSIHRPQQCLPAQGFVIDRAHTEEAPLAGRAPLDLMVIEAHASGGANRIGFAYWFAGRDRETASHWRRLIWMASDRLLHNRASRWAYVSITAMHPFDQPASRQELFNFLRDLHPAIRLP